jgi:hypothetical protein
MRGRKLNEEERKTHLGYSVGDSVYFCIFFEVNETYFGFWVSTTFGDSLTLQIHRDYGLITLSELTSRFNL